MNTPCSLSSGYVDNISSCESADKQLRKRYKDLGGHVGIPTLYGMSALGTKVYFYTHDKETRSILLKRVKDGNLVIDTAPAERWVVYISGWHDILWRWSLDMMTPEGERQLREIVDRVKVMCTQLLKRSDGTGSYMVLTRKFVG